MTFQIQTPTRVVFGSGATSSLAEIVQGFGTRVLLVTGSSAAQMSGALPIVREQLDHGDCQVVHHDSVQPEPLTNDVDAGVLTARREASQLIVAVGGGSAIDTAKAISVGVKLGPSALLLGQTLPDTTPALPVIAIPTTAGSGAEVTKGAILTDPARGVKAGVRGHCLTPRAAVVDPDWLPSMPPHVARQSGFDAFAHCVEGLLARQSSPVSRMWCTEAMSILRRTLPQIGADSASRRTWTDQARASLLGGYVVAHASTGYPHRIQQALGGNTSVAVSHGRGLAAIYPAWIDQLYERLPRHAMDEVAGLFGGTDLRAVVRELLQQLGLPQSLSELGYQQSHIDVARRSLHGNLENDPLHGTGPDALEAVLDSALRWGAAS